MGIVIRKFSKLEEENSGIARKINEIIDWIEEQEHKEEGLLPAVESERKKKL